MNKKFLYLPIEVKNRELVSKLLLAFEAVSRGYKVVIGHRISLIEKIPFLNPGIFFNMHALEHDFNHLCRLKKNGFIISALDEEGPFIHDEENHKKYRVSHQTLSIVDNFFCWGSREKQIILSKYPEFSSKLSLVGNPRFDLLRSEFRHFTDEDSSRIKMKYGDFILINSNFGRFNNFVGLDDYIEILEEDGRLSDPVDKKFYMDEILYQQEVMPEFIKMAKHLAEIFPDKNIVVRVHPSEKISTWEEACKDFKNIHITREGNVLQWIGACSQLIHNNCTTAIESYVMGLQAISYRPVKWKEHVNLLPNILSYEIDSLDELVEHIKTSTNRSPGYENKSYLEEYVVSLEQQLSFQKIVDRFEDYVVIPKTINLLIKNKFFRILAELFYQVKLFIRILVKGEFRLDYEANKFSGISVEEVRAIHSALNRNKSFSEISITQYGKNCIEINALQNK